MKTRLLVNVQINSAYYADPLRVGKTIESLLAPNECVGFGMGRGVFNMEFIIHQDCANPQARANRMVALIQKAFPCVDAWVSGEA